MMTTRVMETAAHNDGELVAASLSGNREAFGEIVARYQSLVCSLAYSATGSLSQSEDLAQETFVAAWKQLSQLREPGRLRSWLCGIARNLVNNWLRRQGREPSHHAETLEVAAESHAPGPLPTELTVGREEEAIMWSSLERISEIYREPLILFYREGESIERVAAAMELSEDAVRQRLSRGRKLLHQEVLALVEGTLRKTKPGKAFTLGVVAALPVFVTTASAATLGTTAVKGSATAKAAGILGLLGPLLIPLIVFGNYLGYRMELDSAESDRECKYVKRSHGIILGNILAFFTAFALLAFWVLPNTKEHPRLSVGLIVGLSVAFFLTTVSITVWSLRSRRSLIAEREVERTPVDRIRPPAWEYRSKLVLLGLPFVHIRIRGGSDRGPIKAWIAAGDSAIGVLFAFGGLAIAPVSIGGCAIGLLPFGGMALGVLALGGFSLGVWSMGGLALGWQAFGGCAIAWNAAAGGAAIAHDFALGGIAYAAQANNSASRGMVELNAFFRYASLVMHYLVLLNLLWVLPTIAWWRIVARSKRNVR
jgi:RNA polymerase sigma factor (sigma-70 family)